MLPLVSVIIPTKDRFHKLTRLLQQLMSDDYPNKEIIVVDDNSKDKYKFQTEEFHDVLVITNDSGPSLARCRNLGIKQSHGKYIFFIDDDNVVANNTISELVSVLEHDNTVGVAGPIMYHFDQPKLVWCAGIKRSFITSLTKYVGAGEIEHGQFTKMDSDEFPNAFICSREVIINVGLFREDLYPFHYGEADFCTRVRSAGYRILMVPSASIWHDFRDTNVANKTRISMHRAYYYGRNRVLFHRTYSKGFQIFSFLIFEIAIIIPTYSYIMFKAGKNFEEKRKLLSAYLKGVLDGLTFCKKKLENNQLSNDWIMTDIHSCKV